MTMMTTESITPISPCLDSTQKIESDTLFRCIFELASDGILLVNLQTYRFVMANPAIGKQLGYTPEELMTMGIRDIHPTEALPHIYQKLESSAQGDSDLHREIPMLCKNGQILLADIAVSQIMLDGERCLLGCFRDVTQQVQREKESRLQLEVERTRRENEERFRSLTESATDAIISINTQGEITFWNFWAERIFQFSKQEVLEQSVKRIIPDRYTRAHLDGFNRALRSGQMQKKPGELFSVFGKRKDGQEIPLEMTISSWKKKGELFFTAILRDVSAKKQMEEQLRHAQKMEAIGTLAGGIAHDFNNILAIILGHVDLAMMNADETPVALEKIQSSALRGRDLVRQLLATGYRTPLQTMRFNPIPMIHDVLNLVRATLPTSILFVENIQDVDITLSGDPTWIHQMVTNLCTNASQAMGEKGGLLEIACRKITLDQANAALWDLVPGDFLQLSVSDTGPGIPSSIRERIFDPFFTTKEAGNGVGLGLSVVQGTIKSFGGAIHVESPPGWGAVFRVLIPAHHASVEQKAEPVVSHHTGSVLNPHAMENNDVHRDIRHVTHSFDRR